MTDDIVSLDVGDDIFRTQVITAACRSEGLRVELVRNDHPETGGFRALQPSYLLVRAEDVPRVQEIIRRSEE
jgi:hypothetical protein